MLDDVGMLNRAYKIVTEACGDHLDRSGVYEVLHPLGLAGQLIGHPVPTQVVALLHDLLEDYSDEWTADKLLEEGFPPEIVRAVVALTRGEDESYMEYIRRVKQNPLATTVKLIDLYYNFNRIDRNISVKQAESLRALWVKAMRALGK